MGRAQKCLQLFNIHGFSNEKKINEISERSHLKIPRREYFYNEKFSFCNFLQSKMGKFLNLFLIFLMLCGKEKEKYP